MNIKKYLPTIFTLAAAGGVIATTVAAINDTPKAMLVLQELEVTDTKITKLDRIKAVAPVYLPTAIICAATIAMIFSANASHRKIEAALAASCVALDKAFKTKRDNVRNGVAMNDVEEDDMIFIEDYLTIPFVAKADDVLEAEEKLNDIFHDQGFATLGDFYELLGITDKVDPIVKDFGWSVFMGDDQGYTDIQFVHDPFEDEKCGKEADIRYTLISYEHEPVINFMEPLWGAE